MDRSIQECVENVATYYGISYSDVVDAIVDDELSADALITGTRTQCIKAASLRSKNPEKRVYPNLIEWFRDESNVYVGRPGRIFVSKPTNVDKLNEERLYFTNTHNYHVTVVGTDETVPIDECVKSMIFYHPIPRNEGDTPYENPYPVGVKKGKYTLSESIRLFKIHAEREWGSGEGRRRLVRDLAGRSLGCFCAQPSDTKAYEKVLKANPDITDGIVCHAQVLMNMVKRIG